MVDNKLHKLTCLAEDYRSNCADRIIDLEQQKRNMPAIADGYDDIDEQIAYWQATIRHIDAVLEEPNQDGV